MSDMDRESARFINDFILRDRRIGDNPKIRVSLGWLTDEGVISYSESIPIGIPARQINLRAKSLSSWVLDDRDAVVVSDLGWASSRDHVSLDLANVGPPDSVSSQLPAIRSMLMVPMLGSTKSGGILAFYALEEGAISQGDIGRAQLLAAILEYVRFRPTSLRSPQSVALGCAMEGVREELGLTQAQLALRLETSRIALSQWERGSWPPSSGPLYEWCRGLGLILPENRALVSVVDITPTLLTVLREDPSRLARLSPQEFERFVAERIDRMGFDVTLTGSTSQRDGGIDLVAIPKVRSVGSLLIAGQIKHHSTGAKVSRSDVDRLLAWKDSVFRLGLLVTNTTFTQDARWVAEQNTNKAFLRLRGFDDLGRWIEDDFYSEAEWNEIPKRITLAPGIIVEIPKATVKDSTTIWPLSVRTDRPR